MHKLLFILIAAISLGAHAATPEEHGLEIAVEIDNRNSGFHDQSSSMVMTLENRHGDTSSRKISNKTLEVDDDGDKSLIIFNHPPDIKGTAFLNFTHTHKADDQWLYLPALKRVKRISSANKSGPFMGSEFSYEDLSSQEIEKYTYKYLRDETIDGRDTLVIERYPTYKHSGYTRHITWIDKEYYQPLRTDFYDRKNARLKTLTYLGYQQYMEHYWRPDTMKMVNHQTGKKTELAWTDYKFQSGLTDKDFTRNSLKRAR